MLINILVVVFIGLLSGSILEFSYKSITHGKIVFPKLVEVQMYIYTAILLYILFIFKTNPMINILFILIFTTGIEFLIGYITFKKGKELWNYKDEWLNYKGIICLKFSLIWLGTSLVFLYILYPWFLEIGLLKI